jgi:hypothetical protein
MSPPLDFIHEFVPGSSGCTLLLLHGFNAAVNGLAAGRSIL